MLVKDSRESRCEKYYTFSPLSVTPSNVDSTYCKSAKLTRADEGQQYWICSKKLQMLSDDPTMTQYLAAENRAKK